MFIKKQRLLTPGPTPLLPQALHAMMGADIHHRTEDFRALYSRVLADLKLVLGTENDALVLVASGSGGLEAAASNFLSPGDTVLICSAGKFGERFEGIAKAWGLNAIVLKAPYGSAVEPAAVAAALAAHPEIKAVLVQASETSTGAMHDIEAIGRLVAETPALMVVDAITGLGTMTLDIGGWGLDVVVGGSQKAFMIPPGIAFVTVSQKAWAASAEAKLPRFYFDLKRELKNAAGGESAWTPSIALLLALDEALQYIKKLGMENLVANAALLARATREAARALGLPLFSSRPGNSVTAILPPEGLDSGVIVKEFRSRFGSIITNGQGEMKGRIFRIAHLGYFDISDVFTLIAQLELILAANGHPVEFGHGVAAAQRVYAEAAIPEALTGRVHGGSGQDENRGKAL
jgi:aspartate aminotransferase-like enzyme